ncbi:MAG: lysophospholipid acyltransferase family protein [Bacteroidales bacterium]|jgi:KDO2-lipid IV(A) lauroyltransferase|nr:lysophospholipid acyltransferase family protein [Bacteroidales bacterium]
MSSLGYYIFYGFIWLISFLPLRVLYVISDFLYLIVCYVIRYRRSVIFENLRNSFPEKTEKERKKIAHQFYRFLCDMFIETIKVLHISTEQIHRRIRYSNPQMFEDLSKKGKQIFFVPGHYGNWEWLATLEHTIPYHHSTLYQPLHNKHFDKLYYDLRTKYGTDAIPSNMVIRAINKYQTENRLTALCFLADQAPQSSQSHYWTTFLNQESSIFLGVEKLSRRYNTAVLYYEIRRVKRGYYVVDTTLITENAAETADKEITDKHVELLEQTIRRTPQYWLWSHRRWKRKRPKEETADSPSVT